MTLEIILVICIIIMFYILVIPKKSRMTRHSVGSGNNGRAEYGAKRGKYDKETDTYDW